MSGISEKAFRNKRNLKICYLLESTNLCGGVRIVFDQARGLSARGHRVVVRALGGDHSWYPYPVTVEYVSDLGLPFNDEAPDIIIGTFWTTIKSAVSLDCPKVFHLCQGFEALLPEYSALKGDIEEAYRLPIPKITVGHWLSDILRTRFGGGSFSIYCAGQIVDTDLYKPGNLLTRLRTAFLKPPNNILVTGIFRASVKAVSDALEAISILRKRGRNLYLTRVTTEDTYEAEMKITPVDRYLLNIPPRDLVPIYHSSSIFIAPSLRTEGFGLPFAEALASGLPAVATEIPSHMSFDTERNYAVFVPEGNPEAIADGVETLLENPLMRLRLSFQGPRLIRDRFSLKTVSEKLEDIFLYG